MAPAGTNDFPSSGTPAVMQQAAAPIVQRCVPAGCCVTSSVLLRATHGACVKLHCPRALFPTFLRLASRVDAITRYVIDTLPSTDVMLLGLLPRAKSTYAQPSNWTAAISQVNDGFR